jgi:hypothetical protein
MAGPDFPQARTSLLPESAEHVPRYYSTNDQIRMVIHITHSRQRVARQTQQLQGMTAL